MRRRALFRWLARWGGPCVLLVALAAAWVGARSRGASPAEPAAAAGPPVERLRPRVLAVYPHDPGAFTQGLLWYRGKLYESTGLKGRSSLRRVDPSTGVVEQRIDLPPALFGEGLARVDDRLVQLTWTAGRAMVYDLATFLRLGEHDYGGEGWGLCYDGDGLVMSDGSDVLTFRDPQTFAPRRRVHVSREGRPVERLNELECAQGWVYANVWTTDSIVRIDPGSGEVTAVIDASGLLDPGERGSADVLNGIAYQPDAGTFMITGKLWPKLFEVDFVRAARGADVS